MITSKHVRLIQRKADWYSTKVRVHFDRPLTRDQAERLVSDPTAVARHPFLPLIGFSKRERRYRRQAGIKTPVATSKTRELAYPGHRDGYIFAYYAEKIGILYEAELKVLGLQDVVIGYRKGSSNIRLAQAAFTEIVLRGDCVALALDIKGFFDNIRHQVLKDCWCHLLGVTTLPDDHYAVFTALTKAGRINRQNLLGLLGLPLNARDRDLPCPICTVQKFRNLRSASVPGIKLVKGNVAERGIPQGTPLSAMAANVSMLWFDVAVHAAVVSHGGSYRRYSDDILILCPPEHVAELKVEVRDALRIHTKTLVLNEDKREEARFALPGPHLLPTSTQKVGKPLQYLGFTFDGARVLLRGGTLSRYYRRLAGGAKAVRAMAHLAKKGKLHGRKVIHRREFLANYSHLGGRSFVSSYVKNAAKIMGPLGAKAIKHQLARHSWVIEERLNRTS